MNRFLFNGATLLCAAAVLVNAQPTALDDSLIFVENAPLHPIQDPNVLSLGAAPPAQPVGHQQLPISESLPLQPVLPIDTITAPVPDINTGHIAQPILAVDNTVNPVSGVDPTTVTVVDPSIDSTVDNTSPVLDASSIQPAAPAPVVDDFFNIVNTPIAPVFPDGVTSFTYVPELAAAASVPEDSLHIINGNTATNPGWMVRLYTPMPNSANLYSGCGGTLIGASWVLTAAHCVYEICNALNMATGGDCTAAEFDRARAYVGITDLHTMSIAPHSPYKRVIIHPKYKGAGGNTNGANQYDIALIELTTPSTNPTLQYLSTATTPTVGQGLVTSLGFGFCQGANCGASTPGDSVLEPKILQTTAPGLPVVQCASSNWAPNFFCLAGMLNGLQASVCQGDSGGPNVMTMSTGTYLVGVTSFSQANFFGMALCQSATLTPNMQSGILRTGPFASWIQGITGIAGVAGDVKPPVSTATTTTRPPVSTATTTTRPPVSTATTTTRPTATPAPTPIAALCKGAPIIPTADKFKVVAASTCRNLKSGATCQTKCKAVGSTQTGKFTCKKSGSNYVFVYTAPKNCPVACDTLKIDTTKWTSTCSNIAIGKTCRVTCKKNTKAFKTYACNTKRAYATSGFLPAC